MKSLGLFRPSFWIKTLNTQVSKEIISVEKPNYLWAKILEKHSMSTTKNCGGEALLTTLGKFQ